MIEDFVPVAYAAMVTVSVAVVALYYRAAWRSARHYTDAPEVDQLIVGIVLSFGGGAVYFAYWIAWRLVSDELRDVLERHWVIGLFAAVYITAALLHIRAASWHRCGERGWITAAGLSALVAVIVAAII